MPSFRRKVYAPGTGACEAPSPEDLCRAQAILDKLRLPKRLGLCRQREGWTQQSSYLSEVWEAFRLSVNEKDMLAAFLRDVPLARLNRTRGGPSLLDIGPDDGQLTLRICGPFSRITFVEADARSRARLRGNLRRHGRQASNLAECRVVPARFPCDGLGQGTYDLALLLHVLYFIPRGQWIQCIMAAYETLRPGGVLVAAYVCDEGAMAELISRFGGSSLRFREFEDSCRRAFPGPQVEIYRMSNVMCALEEDSLAHLFGFLMADYQATGSARETRQYAQRFRRADGAYVWEKTDGAIIITR